MPSRLRRRAQNPLAYAVAFALAALLLTGGVLALAMSSSGTG